MLFWPGQLESGGDGKMDKVMKRASLAAGNRSENPEGRGPAESLCDWSRDGVGEWGVQS